MLDLLGWSTDLLRESTSSTLGQVFAAIVLASPRHASWLSDVDFMARMVHKLSAKCLPQDAKSAKFNVLSAVVDGLPAIRTDGVLQEGLSIATGVSDYLLPSLWNDTHASLPHTAASSICISQRIMMPNETLKKTESVPLSITLPLANTLFLTGRRCTLLVSEWEITPSSNRPEIILSRSAEKRNQTIFLGRWDSRQGVHCDVSVHCPLDSITKPRIVLEVLGNIISKIDVDGKPSPASEELQREIPLWLENRKQQSPTEVTSHPALVWALVTPRRLVEQPDTFAGETHQSVLSNYDKLNSMTVGELVKKGARLHRVCE